MTSFCLSFVRASIQTYSLRLAHGIFFAALAKAIGFNMNPAAFSPSPSDILYFCHNKLDGTERNDGVPLFAGKDHLRKIRAKFQGFHMNRISKTRQYEQYFFLLDLYHSTGKN